jgi:hypothetical protein
MKSTPLIGRLRGNAHADVLAARPAEVQLLDESHVHVRFAADADDRFGAHPAIREPQATRRILRDEARIGACIQEHADRLAIDRALDDGKPVAQFHLPFRDANELALRCLPQNGRGEDGKEQSGDTDGAAHARL